MKKILITLFICFFSTISTFAQIVDTGSCGANLIWTLSGTSSNYTLTISGTGTMTNYYFQNTLPWYSSLSAINTVVINTGATSIGASAFLGCSGLTTISIPNSVTEIGETVFRSCSGLTSVTIGNSVTRIGPGAFQYCSSLTSIYVHNATPALLGEGVFSSVNKNTCTLYVPTGSVSTYRVATQWKDFSNIMEFVPSSQYTMTASAGSNGNISPSGSVSINHGGSQIFTFTPNTGYEIDQVLIDGVNNPNAVSNGSYTFTNITANHTISVTFKINTLPAYSGGSGTQTSPYLISSKADMETLATSVNSGTTYSGKYFLLTNDLTGSNALTTFISNSDTKPFSGIFDGGKHEIELNNTRGVFGYLSNATVQNLAVKGTLSASSGSIGGICGAAKNSTISYCSNTATITTSVNYAGGICGDANQCSISNCYNLGSISTSTPSNYHDFGGICGQSISSAISKCYNLGTISASSLIQSNIGGICGYAVYTYSDSKSILDCYNLGNITALSSGKPLDSGTAYAGGICGSAYCDNSVVISSSILNCYNEGNISASTTSTIITSVASAGGICGDTYYLPISNCYNIGTISADASKSAANAGGISGASFYGQISNCYNFGNISSSTSYYPYAGGICGSRPSNGSSKNSIKNCFVANASITATVNSGDYISYVGRITASDVLQLSISDCYALSTIILNGATVSSTDVTGKDGKDMELSSFQSQPWIESNLGWDFSTIWAMSNSGSANQGLPVFKYQQQNIQTYTITASSGSNGAISPSGNVTVNQGDSQTFTFTPNSGYATNQVLIDGVNNTTAVANGSYMFSNVTANHTISVTFKLKQYTITVSAGSGGNISPSSNQIVIHGNSQTFTFAPNSSYEINQVLIDGVNNTTAVANGSYTFSNVTANHTISVTFKLKQYTITAQSGTGISSTTGSGTYNSGTTAIVGCTVQSGYTFDGWYEGSTKVSSNQSYGFTVTAARTLQARAIQNPPTQYIITTQSGTGISATTGSGTYNSGATATVGCTVQSGYTFDGWYESSTKVSSNQSYSFAVTEARTLQAKATQKTYIITTSAGANGTISPPNPTVTHGDNQVFTFTPNTSYEIDQVLIDGVNNTDAVSTGSYTFANVTASHTIAVSFKLNQYTIITQSGTGISTTTGSGTYNSGATATVDCTVQNGYTFDGWYEGATKVSNLQSYSFSVTAARTLQARAIQNTYTISVLAGSGGAISPASNQIVAHGNSQTFTFTPNVGYEISQVLIDGVNNVGAVSAGSYTFTNVTANHTISVSFKQKQYTISVSAGANGSISPATDQTVNHGNSQPFTFTPTTYYEINQVLIDGVNNAGAVSSGSYIFTNVTANHTIAVSFKQSCLPNLVVQVWDDVLSVINDPARNGGHTFVAYQWQRNGVDMAGETSGNLYFATGKDYDADYSVRLTTQNGQQFQSCPVKLGNGTLKSYPNPTSGTVTVENASIQAGDKIEIYNINGQLVQQFSAAEKQTTLDLSTLKRGTYILKVNGKQVKVIKN
ncbi:MAG: leucine-rich repeat protein [Candidatus Symbiothrix sp.]|jgi:uncharacterized repeat protein (TIGR02543 family)|nr:leucine-rich repeat protein [Candidatus Symbiothrix sp.]